MIKLKRVYEPPDEEDDSKILMDGIWQRDHPRRRVKLIKLPNKREEPLG